MATLLEELATGSHGVRLSIPGDGSVLDPGPPVATVIGPEEGVRWRYLASPLRLTLSDDEYLLQADAERIARGLFEGAFHEAHAVDPSIGDQPRTADPGWSPLVDFRRIRLGDAAALRVIHRVHYRPAYEQIVGRLLVPTASGTVEVACDATDTVTGVRETAITARRFTEADHPPTVASQSFLDDESHDDLADTALARVRRSLSALERKVEVTDPDRRPPERAPFVHQGARCALSIPPGFASYASEAMANPAMATFSRVSLTLMDSPPEILGVWYLGDDELVASTEGLYELAEEIARGWEGEGAERVSVERLGGSTGPVRTEVQCAVRFGTVAGENIEVQHWVAFAGAGIWRVGLSGSASSTEVEPTVQLLRTVVAGAAFG